MPIDPILNTLDYDAWTITINENPKNATVPMDTLTKMERNFLKLNMQSQEEFAVASKFLTFASTVIAVIKERQFYGMKPDFVVQTPSLGSSSKKAIVADLDEKKLSQSQKNGSIDKPKASGSFSFLQNIEKFRSPKVRQPIGKKVFEQFLKMVANVKKEISRQADPHAKMRKNLLKAIKEHHGKLDDRTIPEDLLPTTVPKRDGSFSFSASCDMGKRKDMEDCHIHQEIEQGMIAGVFDGHADFQEVSKLVAMNFPKIFSDTLKEYGNNVLKSFEEACFKMQTRLGGNPDFDFGGSTAVVVFVPNWDKSKIYTMTLGDSQAKLYREIGGTYFMLPLSVCRDFSSKSDEKRVKEFIALAERQNQALDNQKLKIGKLFDVKGFKRRFGDPAPKQWNTNVSRSFGDFVLGAISQKCKVSEADLLDEDFVVVGCDGVVEEVEDSRTIDKVIKNLNGDKSELLLNEALKTSEDNVTAIVMQAKKSEKPVEVPVEKSFFQNVIDYFRSAFDSIINFFRKLFWS